MTKAYLEKQEKNHKKINDLLKKHSTEYTSLSKRLYRIGDNNGKL